MRNIQPNNKEQWRTSHLIDRWNERHPYDEPFIPVEQPYIDQLPNTIYRDLAIGAVPARTSQYVIGTRNNEKDFLVMDIPNMSTASPAMHCLRIVDEIDIGQTEKAEAQWKKAHLQPPGEMAIINFPHMNHDFLTLLRGVRSKIANTLAAMFGKR